MTCDTCGWPIVFGPGGCACTQRREYDEARAEAVRRAAVLRKALDGVEFTCEGVWLLANLKRERQGLSLRQMAGQVDCSISSLSRWSTGKGEPNGALVLRVLKWLHS